MENKHNNHQQANVSPVAAGITGFLLGVVGTAAIAMSDKNTRTKVTKKANEMKDSLEKWSRDTLHDLQSTGDSLKETAKDNADQMKMRAEDTTDRLESEEMLREENKRVL